ncbi:hypothetical protein HPB52_020977 [Rhipicephalus sanguineus]|uniref:Myb/SANT-like DNA-binding domain-containing protein n=1 Tax=Rhipicephalus sanguineus TaxID=34632 RepID=A0A9D4PH51_RHISA|nr:hypothetical protein HPB52_020977 [Rhipicephalus sanguineus]
MKKFKDKKTMWAAIAAELRHETGIERTPLQCENRLKTVKKRYSNARKHNGQSGVSPVEVPYAEEMSKLAATDVAASPPASKRPRTSQSLANVLWMIHKDREEARERRHQEKMALIGQLLSVYRSNRTL